MRKVSVRRALKDWLSMPKQNPQQPGAICLLWVCGLATRRDVAVFPELVPERGARANVLGGGLRKPTVFLARKLKEQRLARQQAIRVLDNAALEFAPTGVPLAPLVADFFWNISGRFQLFEPGKRLANSIRHFLASFLPFEHYEQYTRSVIAMSSLLNKELYKKVGAFR